MEQRHLSAAGALACAPDRHPALRLRPLLWPALGMVQQSEYFDTLQARPYPIDSDERCPLDDKLARALDPPEPPFLRKLGQSIDLPLDPFILFQRGARIAGADIFDLPVVIVLGLVQPDDSQA